MSPDVMGIGVATGGAPQPSAPSGGSKNSSANVSTGPSTTCTREPKRPVFTPMTAVLPLTRKHATGNTPTGATNVPPGFSPDGPLCASSAKLMPATVKVPVAESCPGLCAAATPAKQVAPATARTPSSIRNRRGVRLLERMTLLRFVIDAYGPAGRFLPPVATKLTQSPWFLKPNCAQPPFLHCSLEVGAAGASK